MSASTVSTSPTARLTAKRPPSIWGRTCSITTRLWLRRDRASADDARHPSPSKTAETGNSCLDANAVFSVINLPSWTIGGVAHRQAAPGRASQSIMDERALLKCQAPAMNERIASADDDTGSPTVALVGDDQARADGQRA